MTDQRNPSLLDRRCPLQVASSLGAALALRVSARTQATAATSDNFSLGAQLALQLVSDIGGIGNLVVFNGLSGVPIC